jgi:hypothetical protein
MLNVAVDEATAAGLSVCGSITNMATAKVKATWSMEVIISRTTEL